MNTLLILVKKNRLMLLSILALALLLWSATAGQTANVTDQADSDGAIERWQLEETAETVTPQMAALLADKLPAQDLEFMPFTPCVGGMAGAYPCNNVDLMAFIPLGTFGASAGNDIWGWTDSLTGKEYALMGVNNGAVFVDISDPINPIYLGKLPTQTGSSSWRDIKVYADHAFIVSEASGHGMQIFDLTLLRSVASPPVTFSNTAYYSGFGNAHNVVINEDSGFAYGVGTGTCSGGLHMVNIQNPTSPVGAGCFSGDGYTHDAQCVNYAGPDPDHQGKEICFNSNTDTLTIVDVTNKGTPVQLSRTGYSGSGYTHQGWLSEDHNYFLLGDEADETSFGHNTRTRIWDISDLDNPAIIGLYDGPAAAIDHNLYTLNGYAFESNYRAGLRILDLTDIANANLSEAAYFDIYPSSNSASFNGTWSNYPYYDSGLVVVSGIEQGLFVLDPALAPDYRLATTDTILDVCGNGSDGTTLDLTAKNGYVGNVNLSALDLPAGAGATFGTNPVSPPGSSALTINTTGASSGSYPFTILGDDGAITHTLDLTLNVNDATAGSPTLTLPADGAGNVDLSPDFSWTAAPQATSYFLEVATDPAFGSVVYSTTTSGVSHTMAGALDPLTTYYWRVRADNICGPGGLSATFSFETKPVPTILLVDDDDNSPDVQGTYTAVLDAIGVDYDIWDTGNSDNEPTTSTLSPYEVIIWFSGDEFGGAAGPSGASEAQLGAWLDSGNCLFISSQDYRYDRGQTPFMSTYLGVGTSSDDDGNYTSVSGQGSLFGGLGPYPLSYGSLDDYSDRISPNGSTELAFDGNNGNDAAVNRDSGTYRTTFWGFPFEAISGTASRQEVMELILDWCGVLNSTGTLQGAATEEGSGTPVAGALIQADSGSDLLSTTTNSSGDYALTLPVGSYTVSISADGYFSQTVSSIDVLTDTVTVQDFVLEPAVAILEYTTTLIEGTVDMGDSYTATVTISNSGSIPFNFTTSTGAAWATVTPSGGTVSPGNSLVLTVLFDSTVTAGAGTYNANLTFSGTFDNSVTPISLILHVNESGGSFVIYVPYFKSE